MNTKQCTKCKEIQELSEFSKKKASPDGLQSRCKSCSLAINKKWQSENREKVKASNKKYYSENREKVNEYHRVYQREYQREYQQRPEEKVKIKARRKLNSAIRSGTIIRPTQCSSCNKSDCEIQAHHPDHKKPLEVEFLCKSCHIKADQVLRSTNHS